MNPKTLLLNPIVVFIYNKMIKSPCGPVVAEDLRYWSMKIFGEERPLKSFFISKLWVIQNSVLYFTRDITVIH